MDTLRTLTPKPLLSLYHFLLAHIGAWKYGHPSRELVVIAITGTKGKSSTTEYVNAIFEAAGFRTALSNTIRFKIGTDSRPNKFKMTMPGRFFIQKFLRDAVEAGCTHAILEISSEGAKQFRERGIDLDGFIFLNLAPEHIESHGSYEKYVEAKVAIARQLGRSRKIRRVLVANTDDKESEKFLALNIPTKRTYSLADAKPYTSNESGSTFMYEHTEITTTLPGEFTISNMLSAIVLARAFDIDMRTIKHGLENVTNIPGRLQKIDAGQNFTVIVDYAHTPDSLTALYGAYKNSRTICLLGNTGGGRDTWKRPKMGAIADECCDEVILANEDPYDEDPRTIVEAMAAGMERNPHIIMDRREAIRAALSMAHTGDVVLITGKGTDPYIMEERGKKTPWSDAVVTHEELEKLLAGSVTASK